MTTPAIETPVLIVGGGPVGLAASIALSRCGVRSLLVERHPGTTTHPKATVVNARTMELFRLWGVAPAVVAGGVPFERMRYVVWATTLAGIEIGRLDFSAQPQRLAELLAHSPMLVTICPQDVVEPLLLARARSHAPAQVRFHSELVEWGRDADGVSATVVDRSSGARTAVRARYVIAADGRRSPLRSALGITLRGHEPLGDMLNIHVRADLRRWIDDRPGPLYWIVNPDAPGVLIALNGTDRWLFDVPYDAAAETLADYPPARCADIVRRAAGVPDLDVEVRDVSAWSITRVVAERYRVGHVFLAGDAAHQFPPTGGFGMNCGIQDAHNLAWKLAAVLQGWAEPGLLDTYEAERRPVAEFYTALSAGNALRITADMRPPREIEEPGPAGAAIRRFIADGIEPQRAHFDSAGAALGYAYESSAVIADGTPAPQVANPVMDYVPTARPGHRAPHLWLVRDGQPISTVDLCDGAFTVLVGPAGRRWADAAVALASTSGVPLRPFVIGPGGEIADPDDAFQGAYGLAADGAVLVRPDGFVAWRHRGGGVSGAEADMLRAVFVRTRHAVSLRLAPQGERDD